MANTTTYNPKSIEPKWQKYWEEHGTFKTDVWDFSKPKYYALDMFPYPSGLLPVFTAYCSAGSPNESYPIG